MRQVRKIVSVLMVVALVMVFSLVAPVKAAESHPEVVGVVAEIQKYCRFPRKSTEKQEKITTINYR